MRFRKKPVVVEAELYVRNSDSTPNGICCCLTYAGAHIHTLEGVMNVSDGDWIIRGVAGEYYPCKPDIFEETYEAVE